MTPAHTLDTLRFLDRLALRDRALQRVRAFFRERGYTEVETRQRVPCPGIDPHVDALPAGDGLWLATSPEIEMKKLLAAGATRVFQLSRAFRGGERGDLHSPEFTLLEWYGAGEDYADLMDATEALVRGLGADLALDGLQVRLPAWPEPFARLTVDEAFARWAGWSPSREFEPDRFFRDLVESVEPRLAGLGAVFLRDWPEPLGALARRSPANPAVCERVELYLDGIEICNGFSELTDAAEQASRFARDNAARAAAGKPPYPVDEGFLDALRAGVPPCAGNALGFDRLLLALLGGRRLAQVTLLS